MSKKLSQIHLLSCVVILMTSSGCAFRAQSTRMALDHNEFVAQTGDSQIALNILRARDRAPRHFTSFANLSGKIGLTASEDTTIFSGGNGGESSFGADGIKTSEKTVIGVNNLTFLPKISITSNSDYILNVEQGQEFYTGILSVVQEPVIVHFLQQGWDKELLSHLVISNLTFSINNGKEKLYVEAPNTPDSEKVKLFAQAVACRQLTVDYAEETTSPAVESTNFETSDSTSSKEILNGLERIANAIKPVASTKPSGAGLAFGTPTQSCDEFRKSIVAAFGDKLPKTGSTIKGLTVNATTELEVANLSQSLKLLSRSPERPATGVDPISTLVRSDRGARTVVPKFVTLFQKGGPDQIVDLTIDVTFRSPEGIIYYLGEYLRNPANSPKLTKSESCPELPIIAIVPRDAKLASLELVAVRYSGKTWSVLGSGGGLCNSTEGGRTSQVITFIQQLLALQRSAKELQTTPLVRVQ